MTGPGVAHLTRRAGTAPDHVTIADLDTAVGRTSPSRPVESHQQFTDDVERFAQV